MLVELAVDHFLGGSRDYVAELRVELPQRDICDRGGALYHAQTANDGGRHALAADAEILERSLRLRTPIAVRGNFDGTEGVGLSARLRHGNPSISFGRNRDLPLRRARRRVFLLQAGFLQRVRQVGQPAAPQAPNWAERSLLYLPPRSRGNAG